MRMTTAAVHPRRRAKRGEGERLREEILAAARDLLAETQDADAVSVRMVADKAALLDAVCEAVFAELDQQMEEAAATTDDPFDGLRLRGLAYSRFALSNPEQYRLAMMRMPAHHLESPPFSAEDIVGGPTYHHLTEAVQRCIDVGVFAPGIDPQRVATTLWAAAHGAVSLCLAKPGLAGEDAEALCDMVIAQAGMGAAFMSYVAPEGHDHPDHTPGRAGPGEGGSRTSVEIAALLRSLPQM